MFLIHLSILDATVSPVIATILQSQKPTPIDEQVKYSTTTKANEMFFIGYFLIRLMQQIPVQ
jgi:hypothetical protein